jgi:hypothetical protein
VKEKIGDKAHVLIKKENKRIYYLLIFILLITLGSSYGPTMVGEGGGGRGGEDSEVQKAHSTLKAGKRG